MIKEKRASWTDWLRLYFKQFPQATLNGADRMPFCQPQRFIDRMGTTAGFDLHEMYIA
jgi:hypothetical protein